MAFLVRKLLGSFDEPGLSTRESRDPGEQAQRQARLPSFKRAERMLLHFRAGKELRTWQLSQVSSTERAQVS